MAAMAAVYARRTSLRIGQAHLSDQAADLAWYFRPTSCACVLNGETRAKEQAQKRDHCQSTYPIPPLTPARTEFSGRTGIAGVGAVCLAAEIDANEVGAAELVQPIVHAPADAGAVEEHRIGVVQIDLLHDWAGDLHEVRDAELHGRDRGRRARGGSG
jgi:hypothetical protein